MRQSDNPALTVIEESLDLTSKEKKQFRDTPVPDLFGWIRGLFGRRKEESEDFYLRDTGSSFPANAEDEAFDGILGENTE